ncbi:hypothetical protein FHR24_001514 [Wenyingzhuangia heitensis]|uniref:Uncharacterized protein n=1 Tax=Wenyingzhuangia heitensis TaxID=1487859 RepID=A0ABX0U8A3_9FLAO|nr:hypothetical protein [Wenyingzhuangia heitensis]NIJ45075.1 hypothetical protein [Wenyingzhuangia heitensis]
MFWSKNNFFKQQKADVNEAGRLQRLAHKRKVVKRLLEIKKFHEFEIDYFLEAYDYMVENKNVFDGATIVKDADDIPKLEISAMLHDYQYVALLPKFKGSIWFKMKNKFDKEYRENLIRFGNMPQLEINKKVNLKIFQIRFSFYVNSEQRIKNRYNLLRISTPFYWLIKLF